MRRKSLLILFVLCLVTAVVPVLEGWSSGGNVLAVETSAPPQKLVPCGNAIGIKIETEGVMVVDKAPGFDGKSELIPGDVITKANGEEITDVEDLREVVSMCNGEVIFFEVRRDGDVKTVTVHPAKNPVDNSYYIGAWVRDSTAGIGTMTWFDPETGRYGALGHGITDVDTKKIMEVSEGEIVRAEIIGADKGSRGNPGLLMGNFLERMGNIEKNGKHGISGKLDTAFEGEAIEVAKPSEVKEGKAQILCCITGTSPEFYDVTLEHVMTGSIWGAKNMVVRIDDERIISKTGGIVQGMSGSPIIQNGKLVGAVTHVFVNDPTRGYGIFIENMLAAARSIEEKNSENF